jgi:hypothetical protein
MDDDVQMMTYADAAKALRVQVDSIKRRARNRRWRREKGNDGLIRVGIPLDALAATVAIFPDSPGDMSPAVPRDMIRLEKEVSSLQTEVRFLREREADLKADRDAWKAVAERRRTWWPFR